MANQKAPFPTAEQILEFIRNNPDRASKREITRAFQLKGEEKIKLKQLLRQLGADGKIDKGHRSNIHISSDLPPVTVIEITGIDKYGDLTARPAEWSKAANPPKILLYARDKNNRIGIGDRALVRLAINKEKGEIGYVAKIIRKLEYQSSQVLGVFKTEDENIACVSPTEKKDRNTYLIAKSDWGGAKQGDLVLVQIKPKGRNSKQLKAKPAKVIKCIGSINEPKAISLIAIHSHGIRDEFSETVLNEAKVFKDPTLANCQDLREYPLITVDPSDARDHDDAIWAELDLTDGNQGGCHIIVAIADVARYVLPGSELDKEAWKRGNSTYFPDRVVPMLPETLSNGLCSLHEGVDRYTLAVHMWFDKNGKKKRHKFVRGLMNSIASLSYEEFQLAYDGTLSKRTEHLLATVIKPLYQAYNIIKKGRDYRTPLELTVPEKKIILDNKGNIDSITTRISLTAHKLVEEFMIQANVSAAQEIEQKNIPCMYRVHEQPSLDKLENLRKFMLSIGHNFAKGQVIKPKIFNNLLNNVADTAHESVVNTIILRTQMQAKYSSENFGHFGLSLAKYAHFTSPIRRYADVLVHRALIYGLKLGNDGLSKTDIENFSETADHISTTERVSMVAERECNDRYLAAWMSNQIDEIFEGKIGGVNRAGLFITLTQSGGDGFIPISSMIGDYFHHDEERHLLEGEYSKLTYQLGDAVTVRLKEANPITGGLILELLDDNLSKLKGHQKAIKNKRKFRKNKR
jgi:ribonuclease R